MRTLVVLTTLLLWSGWSSLPGQEEVYGPPLRPGTVTGEKATAGRPGTPPTPATTPIPEGMQGPMARVEDPDHDWGKVLQGTEYHHTFQVHNDGDMPLMITHVKPG